MTDVGRHPNITLLSLSEVAKVKGYVGNFEVHVNKKARYINEKECTACGDCLQVCPVVVPDEFNLGLSSRRAIYQPFPQAVPAAYVINIDECLGNDPIICGKCVAECKKKCIDFNMSDEELVIEVGTIIVATGLELYNPEELDEYGYTRYHNVITSIELERLINAGGPTEGNLVRLTDLKPPKSVAFIQCVGSRSERRGNPYCSNICCMNTIKDTLLIREYYPDTEVKVFYIDIRAFGKGFEDLFKRSKAKGVRYIRGLPGQITEDPKTHELILTLENTMTGKLETHRVDMVVLALGMQPRKDMHEIQEMLSLQQTSDGFFMESHPKLEPVDAATRGIFFAGCSEGPKDIRESVTQASAAAARAMRLMTRGEISVEAITAQVIESKCKFCGICQDVCPYNAIHVDKERHIPASVTQAACTGCGTCAAECPFDAIVMNHFNDDQIFSQIDAILVENPQDKIVTFACNWCSYAGADFAGTSRLQYPPNARLIRVMCSGRVDEKFIWHAFRHGAPVVLVSGCHLGDCHYNSANHYTQKRIERVWKKMEKRNIRKDRLQLEWISAAEGIKFMDVMKKTEALRQSVTPEEIEATKDILRQKEK
jgi:heterodisulfide reductase subunit A